MAFAILIGQTLTLPARVITDDMLHAKMEWARAHNVTDSIRFDLVSGANAKILSAYERKPGRDWDSVVSVEFDENEVRITGTARGPTQVEIIDEVSSPGGTTGQVGGVEILVQDEIDQRAMIASVTQEIAVQDAAEQRPPEPPPSLEEAPPADPTA
jgi:hypothetical protein